MFADPGEDVFQAALGEAPVGDPESVLVLLHFDEQVLSGEALQGDLVHEVPVELADQDRLWQQLSQEVNQPL